MTHSGLTATDWTAIGTLALAGATTAAVVLTSVIAVADRRRDDRLRREAAQQLASRDAAQRHQRQFAQAALVLVGTPGYESLGKSDDGQYRHKLTFTFANYAERPVLDVYVEAWGTGRQSLAERGYDLHARVVQSGAEETWHMDIVTSAAKFSMNAFRYRWTDPDGTQFFIDQREQRQPLPYEGQDPRPY